MVNLTLKNSLCLFIIIVSLSCQNAYTQGALVPQTADQDPRIPAIALNISGHRRLVHIETFGNPSDPAVLVLHGSLGDFRALKPLKALAESGYYLVFWDQRGNGLSERITESEYTEESILAEIDAIAAYFSPGKPFRMVGHSFGAMYTSLYLSVHPERVLQAVLIEPGGLNGDIFTKTFKDIININLLDPKMNSLFWAGEHIAPQNHESADYLALMMLLNGKQMNYHPDPDRPCPWPVWRPGAYVEIWRNNILGSDATGSRFSYDFARGAASYPKPVLFIGGTGSALGAEYQRKHHVPLFPNGASVVSIPGTGHRLVQENPDASIKAILGYFK
ncbi:hypothetical protein MASR2M78_31360 [Treponema sp.]